MWAQLPACFPWCVVHMPPLLPPLVFWVMLHVESSHASVLYGLSWPGVADCGYACWGWLTTTWWITHPLSPHTHTIETKQSSAQFKAVLARETTVLLARWAWRLILTSRPSSQQHYRKHEKLKKINQGAKGRREKAEPQPSAVRVSLLLSVWFVPLARSDSCPTDSSAHAPVGLLEQLNERLHVRIWPKS